MTPVEQWLEALESGEYTQGRRTLSRSGSYCCLGVACDVYQKAVGGLKIEEIAGRVHFEGFSAQLPEKVRDWLGLASSNGGYVAGASLVKLNDIEGMNFEEIAAVIRSRPKGLFYDSSRNEGNT